MRRLRSGPPLGSLRESGLPLLRGEGSLPARICGSPALQGEAETAQPCGWRANCVEGGTPPGSRRESGLPVEVKKEKMRIDAHQHVWTLARGDYDWPTPALAPIYRDFGMADLEPFLEAHAIDATILVQVVQTEAETDFMLDTARASERVAGVVGWTDFDSPDAPEKIARLAEEELLVGLRPMVHNIAADDWMLVPAVGRALEAMQRERLVLDMPPLPRHLSRLLVLADRHPELPIVVDHLAKPFIATRKLDPWRADMAALAARPNVVCKLSGMVTEAARDWTVDDLRPYAEHVIGVFGPARILFGSDWPVVDLAGGYSRWLSAAEALTAHLPSADRAAIFGGNAERLYLSERGRRPC